MRLRLVLRLTLLGRAPIEEGAPDESFSLLQAASYLSRRVREQIPGTPPLAPREQDYVLRAVRRSVLLQKIARPTCLACVRSRVGYLFYESHAARLLGDLPDERELLAGIQAGEMHPIKRPLSKRRLRTTRAILETLREAEALAEKLSGTGPITRGSYFAYIELPLGSPMVLLIQKALAGGGKMSSEPCSSDAWNLSPMPTAWRLTYKSLVPYGRDTDTPWVYDKMAERLRQRGLGCRSYFRSD